MHKRVVSTFVILSAALASAALVPAAAQAGAALSVAPTFPTTSQVGETGLAASLTLTNANTGTDSSATICNASDIAPCPLLGEGITLVSSCGGQGADSGCAGADSGVLAARPGGHGAAGAPRAG